MRRFATARGIAAWAAALFAMLPPSPPSVFADEPAVLRWKLASGSGLRFTLTQTTTLDSTPEGGRTVNIECRQEADLRWEVGAVGDEGAEITLVIDRLRAHESRDGVDSDFVFDSAGGDQSTADPHDARMAAMLKAVAGARITFRLTPRGEVLDVKFPDELLDSLRRSETGAAPPSGSEDGVRNLIALAAPFLPEGPSGAGVTWTRQISAPMPMLGCLILDKTYTDRGSRADRPEVHDVDLETRFSFRPMPGAVVESTLVNQTGVGTFAFDARRGLIESGSLKDALTIRYDADGRRVDQSITTQLTLKLTSVQTASP